MRLLPEPVAQTTRASCGARHISRRRTSRNSEIERAGEERGERARLATQHGVDHALLIASEAVEAPVLLEQLEGARLAGGRDHRRASPTTTGRGSSEVEYGCCAGQHLPQQGGGTDEGYCVESLSRAHAGKGVSYHSIDVLTLNTTGPAASVQQRS